MASARPELSGAQWRHLGLVEEFYNTLTWIFTLGIIIINIFNSKCEDPSIIKSDI